MASSTQLKCFKCERFAGLGQQLRLIDFGVDKDSGTLVCKDCYTNPKDNKVTGANAMIERGKQVASASQGLAIKAAQARLDANRSRQRGY